MINKQNTENIFIKSDNKIKIFKFVFPKLFFDTLLSLSQSILINTLILFYINHKNNYFKINRSYL